MSLIIKGRIQYSPDDGSPVIDLTDFVPNERNSNLSWKDEEAFVDWVKQKVRMKMRKEEEV